MRGNSDLTSIFEDFVNAVLENVSPPPKMMFPISPYDISVRVKKAFGVE